MVLEQRAAASASTEVATAQPALETRPTTVAQLRDAVRTAVALGHHVRAVELDTAEAEPAAHTSGVGIHLGGLRGIVEVDDEARTATFRSGTTIDQAATYLEGHGYSMVGAPSNPRLTLAAAVATGAHSGAPTDASFSGSIAGIALVTANGDLVRVTSHKFPHLWGAARLNLGAIGIIAEVTVRVRPYQALRVKRVRRDLASLLRELPEAREKVDYYSATWRPGHDGARLTLGWLEDASPAQVAARRTSLTSITAADERKPGLFTRIRAGIRRLVAGSSSRFSERSEGGVLAEGRDVSGAGAGAAYLEYQFPLYRGGLVVEALHELAHGNSAFARASARLGMVARDDVWLSPAYGQDVFTIAIEVPDAASDRNREALAQAEELFIFLGGLPSWAGWNTFNAGEAADVMPRYSDFAHVAHDLDPYGQFGNAQTARVVH
jgi:FAD/FMN-containing dehydrogenase